MESTSIDERIIIKEIIIYFHIREFIYVDWVFQDQNVKQMYHQYVLSRIRRKSHGFFTKIALLYEVSVRYYWPVKESLSKTIDRINLILPSVVFFIQLCLEANEIRKCRSSKSRSSLRHFLKMSSSVALRNGGGYHNGGS